MVYREISHEGFAFLSIYTWTFKEIHGIPPEVNYWIVMFFFNIHAEIEIH